MNTPKISAPIFGLSAEALRSAGALLLLSASLLYLMGLTDNTLLHTLTHDARHLLGFPCH